VSPDAAALSRDVAAAVASTITKTVYARGRCSLVLSGGSTPRPIYHLLSSEFRASVPCSNVEIFWGDERFVPPLDPRSNYGAALNFVDAVAIPEENIHPIRTNMPTASEAAAAYEATLRSYSHGDPTHFDLLLLGIGVDGHTASLFPHSPALNEKIRTVVSTVSPADSTDRITLTLPVLLASRVIFVVASGADKAPALRRALARDTPIADCPAAALRLAEGSVVWWVDRAAMP
jgi:6-phosphogluconolactonase